MRIRLDAPDPSASRAYQEDLLNELEALPVVASVALEALCSSEARAHLLAEACLAEATAEGQRPSEARAWLAESREWMREARESALARHALTPSSTPAQPSTECQEPA